MLFFFPCCRSQSWSFDRCERKPTWGMEAAVINRLRLKHEGVVNYLFSNGQWLIMVNMVVIYGNKMVNIMVINILDTM